VSADAQSGPSLQRAAFLARTDGEVDVVDVLERPAAQDGVAVAAASEAVLGGVRRVPHAELRCEHSELFVVALVEDREPPPANAMSGAISPSAPAAFVQ
jgi:hypothetical protein